MLEYELFQLRFGWWNTSLSPISKTNRATSDEIEIADNLIVKLLNEYFIDCLALGEISNIDINRISSKINKTDYAIIDATKKDGRVMFDLGIIYNKTKMSCLDNRSITNSFGIHDLKIAHRVDFQIAYTDNPIHLFVSHWPSRIYYHENDPVRDKLGHYLGEHIKKIHIDKSSNAHIVLMGDFNDEPFNQSISDNILATRDRRFAIKKNNFLYNPFWRHLGEKEPHVPKGFSKCFSGTCYYKGDDNAKWHTFDQIMVSSSCLRGCPWHLKENCTAILEIPPLDSLIPSSKTIFDHFPVMSVLERELYVKGGTL
jgi:hypothetical protein